MSCLWIAQDIGFEQGKTALVNTGLSCFMQADLGFIGSRRGSEPVFSDEPMPSFGSGRYEECFYRVAGDRPAISIPRAQGRPATRKFDSVTGYLTR